MTDEIKKLLDEYIERKYKGLAFNDINKQGFQDAVELFSDCLEALEKCASPYSSVEKENVARQARTNLIAKLRGEKWVNMRFYIT